MAIPDPRQLVISNSGGSIVFEDLPEEVVAYVVALRAENAALKAQLDE